MIFIPLCPACCSRRSSLCISSDCLRRSCADDGTGELCCAGVFAIKSFDECFVESCTDGTRSKASACDRTHNAANSGMNGDLASAAIVLQVVGETECLLTEDCGKFLLFLDFRLVEDLPSSLSEFAV